MVKLIGKNNCNSCTMTKTILTNKNVEFEYFVLEELPKEDQDFYINLAKENNMLSLPLIVIDNKLKTLQDII